MANSKYQQIPGHEDDIELTSLDHAKSDILGYHLPNIKKPVIFNSDSHHISYTDVNGNTVTLRQEHIPGFLREVRQQSRAGWRFHDLFKNMPERKKFEDYLTNSPSTALLDYRLLCLGDHIQYLNSTHKPGSTNIVDTQELSNLYSALVARLQQYEHEIGELTNKPSSRHQNNQRKALVSAFQADWQNRIQPVVTKYKNTRDTYNILLNVATILGSFGLGLAWLFLKNLWRLSQRKGLGLFQFEQAHSRKVEHLEKFYADVMKATENDAKALDNYFANDLDISKTSFNIFSDLIDRLSGLQKETKFEGSYTKKEKRRLGLMVEAFRAVLFNLQTDLQSYQNHDTDETLPEIQAAFMEAWHKATQDHDVSSHTSILTSKYPLEITQVIAEIEQISQQLAHEHAASSGRHSPDSDDSSQSSSQTLL